MVLVFTPKGWDNIAQGKPQARPWVTHREPITSTATQGGDSKAVLPWAMLSHPFRVKTKKPDSRFLTPDP